VPASVTAVRKSYRDGFDRLSAVDAGWKPALRVLYRTQSETMITSSSSRGS